jgi:Pyruvate/2-oxoacid:ferredoxin oxidoreductase delta subunit
MTTIHINPDAPQRTRLVCAGCGVYCREERVFYDQDGNAVMHDTCCAYCGRCELRFAEG